MITENFALMKFALAVTGLVSDSEEGIKANMLKLLLPFVFLMGFGFWMSCRVTWKPSFYENHKTFVMSFALVSISFPVFSTF